ncbi:uncharacterized protein PODANS_6_3605 [Podospora anserina S mat+]|uniref:Podospora anserina S mat+ genomic DNA chromosome 6, supercontig 2 n=1 Tax=Podospora anserina (strain S / ATCC MYA-4624 / DSM 980 / FGSC 10383) TaxID=515849 RepID=B2B2C7_PODAN|nr:uncharacterized protein PODANS_6_3605 [Podospora anserina S mat+]CAP71262.1 unnamed protein product [Podospora anserina S mat+]CDP30662.1 Putative protein of unknown function [Podospora anserina S mat+]
MKFTTLTTLATTALLTTAKADIWIYEGTDLGSGGEVLWLFFPGFPPPHSCEDVKNTRLILQKWDVSEIEGVVCDGDGCYNGNISSGWSLMLMLVISLFIRIGTGTWLGLKDKVWGHCRPTEEDEYDCPAQYLSAGQLKFNCETDVFP